jgi:hypothetical protein
MKAAFGLTSRNAKVLYRHPAQIDWVAHASSGSFDDTLSNDFGYSISASLISRARKASS